MRNICKLCIALAMMCMAVSCNSDDDYNEQKSDVEPPKVRYQFINDKAYIDGKVELPEITQDLISREVIGYGWEWISTNEIMPDGTLNPKDYCKVYGAGPKSYYISSTSLTKFHYGGLPTRPYCIHVPGTINLQTGWVDDELGICSVYYAEGHWYMVVTEPLGVVREGCFGPTHTVYGCSQLVRMSEERLQEFRERHCRNRHNSL